MDISSRGGYPSATLSNFAPHPFVIDGVECASMEGFLQSLKFKSPDMQVEVCKLVGLKAKFKGAKKNWRRDQCLYWRGEKIQRTSKEYQDLLGRAYGALSKNEKFKRALLLTRNATLTHSKGKSNQRDTVLTKTEFCGRLTSIRERLKNEA